MDKDELKKEAAAVAIVGTVAAAVALAPEAAVGGILAGAARALASAVTRVAVPAATIAVLTGCTSKEQKTTTASTPAPDFAQKKVTAPQIKNDIIYKNPRLQFAR